MAKPEWKITVFITKHNAKFTFTMSDLSEARKTAVRISEKGVWDSDTGNQDIFWCPGAISKISIQLVPE